MLYFPFKVKLTYEFTYVKQIMSNIEQSELRKTFFKPLLRSENLQTIREYKSLKKPEFSQMQQRNQTRSH